MSNRCVIWGIASIVCIFTALSSAQITILTDTGTTVVDLPDFQSQIQADGQIFFVGDRIQYLGDTGQPQLPWQVITVLLSPDADLSAVICEIEDSTYESIDGAYQITPIPPATTRDENNQVRQIWPEGKRFLNGKDLDIYETDAFWPNQPAQILRRGNLDQANLVQIAVPLVRYNPQQQSLKRLTQLRLRISEQRGAQKMKTLIPSGKFRKSTRLRLERLAVNFEQAAADYESYSDSAGISDMQITANPDANGYAIITTNTFVSSSTQLSAFITHKQSLGFTVHLITEDDFGGGMGQTSADNLRSWLQSNYLSLDLLYVLLIGNPHPTTSSLAMKMVYDGDHPTDYYFAELTGDWDADGDGIYGEEGEMDKFFEVYVGRIPYYGIISDTDLVLQKIISYENSTDTSWRRNALLPMVPLDSEVTSHELGEQTKEYLLEPEQMSSDRIYDETYGVTPPPEYIRSNSYPATVWSQNKYGLVVWQTHGWDDNASGIINNGDVWALNNSYPATVWQGSCRNAYAENSDTLAWRILKNGAVATIGATRNSYYWSGQTWYVGTPTVGGMGYEYAKRIMQYKPCGQAIYEMKEALDISNLIRNFYVFNLYGDPSMVMLPEKPALTISPTDAFYISGRSHTEPDPDTRTYTLYNNSTSSLSWNASWFADWISLSPSNGTIPAESSVTVDIQINSNALSLSTGKHTDSVVFSDLTNGKTVTRKVILDLQASRLRGHWRLDETSGTVASDSSGGWIDGTLHGCTFATSSVSGKFGRALLFDGSNDYITLPTIQSDFRDGLTVSVWAYPMAVMNWARFIDFGNGSASDNILFSRRETTNNLVVEVWNGSTSGGYVTASGAIELNKWQMFTMTVDMTGATKIYKNAQLITSGTTGIPNDIERQFNYFAESNWGADSFYRGYMDDIWIYNRVLDINQIQSLYVGGPAEAPHPADGAAEICHDVTLSWDGGYDPLSYDVYFGTSRDDVKSATTDSPEYQGYQTELEYELENLVPNRQYYWKIDKTTSTGFIPGDIWVFYITDAVGWWQFADDASSWPEPEAVGSFVIADPANTETILAENSDGFTCSEGSGTSFGEFTDLPSTLHDTAAGSMTMFARVRFSSFSGIDDIWRMGQGDCEPYSGTKPGFGGQETFALELINGKPRFVVSSDGQIRGSEFETMVTHATTLQTNKWYDITGVFTADPDLNNPAAQGSLKIYIFDPATAQQVGTAAELAVDFDALETDWNVVYSGLNVLFLEAPCNGNGTNTGAQLELAALWNHPLDEDEIAMLSMPAGEPPYFISDPFSAPDANVAFPYSESIADSATDPDPDDELSYFKIAGPEWVTVDANGIVTGRPWAADEGLNTIDLRVRDNTYRCATGTLQVNVKFVYMDFIDFALVASQWLNTDCGLCGGGDFDGNNNVDINDLRIVTENWLGGQ